MASGIEIPEEQLKDFCRKWGLEELALFGSVLTNNFRLDSDVDVMVTFASDSSATLFDMVDMQDELERLFGRRVDLVSRSSVEASENYIRRRSILDSAKVVCGA